MKNIRGYIDLQMLAFLAVVGAIMSLILFVLICVTGFPGGINSNYSEGVRVGVVNKLSYKGLIYKSYEAEAAMTGLRKASDSDGNTTLQANIFEFNVPNELFQAVQDAADFGKPVKLYYRQWFIKPIGISSGYVLSKIETAK